MNALIIANTQIRRDVIGRYCLNDLHQSSGAANKNRPSIWLENRQTKDLIAELESPFDENGAGIPAPMPAIESVQRGMTQGTYAVKELVYAYAMWISPKFHLHVIRAYDTLVTQAVEQTPAVPSSPQHRADVIVSASRGFTALVRAGRCMGLDRLRSVAAANAATLRATGIDLVHELDAADMVEPADALPPALNITDQMRQKIAAYLHGRNMTTMDEVILVACHGNPASKDLQTRAGIAMRRLGWQSRRNGIGNARVRVWYPPDKPAEDSDVQN